MILFYLHHNSLSISVGVCALHAVIIAESCLSFYITLQVPTVSNRDRDALQNDIVVVHVN